MPFCTKFASKNSTYDFNANKSRSLCCSEAIIDQSIVLKTNGLVEMILRNFGDVSFLIESLYLGVLLLLGWNPAQLLKKYCPKQHY
jgi:hypothetical protein